jgi:ABC-type transporter Mla subunit MlaD
MSDLNSQGYRIIGLSIVIIIVATMIYQSIDFNMRYYLLVEEGQKVSSNSKVYLNGVEIGRVQSIDLVDPTKKVLIELEIENKYSVPTGSKYYLNKIDFFSDKAIEIEPDMKNMDGKNVKFGDTVKLRSFVQSELSIEDSIRNEKATKLMKTLMRKAGETLIELSEIDSLGEKPKE